MSMLSHMHVTNSMPERMEVLYSTRRRETASSENGASIDSFSEVKDVLFADRLQDIASHHRGQVKLKFFLTEGSTAATEASEPAKSEQNVSLHSGKITQANIEAALGRAEERGETVCYVCGPQKMTDHFVSIIGKAEGMSAERVFCEKWW